MPGIDPKRANVLYHDAAARSYDEKWSIAFDKRSLAYVRDRARRMLPRGRYGKVLEVGSGTGFFLLNLWRAGFVEEAHATDISTGMLEACAENARRLGCDLRPKPADAEGLPYPDETFDLVVGHAFFHHLPEPRDSLAEAYRVLMPGGALLIAGEPTRLGHRIAEGAKRTARATVGLADWLSGGRLCRAQKKPSTEEERVLRELEFAVDLHTFDPDEVAGWARAIGFRGVRLETEELLSSLFGWANRTLEAQLRPGLLGPRWPEIAYRAYTGLYGLDRLLYRVVPKRLFYNLLLYGERPAAS